MKWRLLAVVVVAVVGGQPARSVEVPPPGSAPAIWRTVLRKAAEQGGTPDVWPPLLEALAAQPEPVRAAVRTWLAARDPTAARTREVLPGALVAGWLGGTWSDPFLAELLADVTPGPAAQLAAAQVLAQAGQLRPAAALVRSAAGGGPLPLPLLLPLVGLLDQTDQSALALPLLRRTEAAVDAAEARTVRGLLYAQLLRQPGGGLHPLVEARTRPLAVQAVAVADALWAVRQTAEAQAAYRDLMHQPAPPETARAAWLGYAETAPELAWAERAAVLSAAAAPSGGVVRRALYLAGLAAGQPAETLAVLAPVSALSNDPELAAALCGLALLTADPTALDRWQALPGDLPSRCIAVLDVLRAPAFAGDLVIGPRLRGAGGAFLRRASTSTLLWAAVAARATRELGDLTTAPDVCEVWTALLLASPLAGDRRISEGRRQLVAALLAWSTDHPADPQSRLELLPATFQVLRPTVWEDRLPEAFDLLAGLLPLWLAQGRQPAEVRAAVETWCQHLAVLGVAPGDAAQFRSRLLALATPQLDRAVPEGTARH